MFLQVISMKTWVEKLAIYSINDRWTIPFGPTLNLCLFVREISRFHLEVTLVVMKKIGPRGQIFYLRIPLSKTNNLKSKSKSDIGYLLVLNVMFGIMLSSYMVSGYLHAIFK